MVAEATLADVRSPPWMIQLSFAEAEAPRVVAESPPVQVDVLSNQGVADGDGSAKPATIHAIEAGVFDDHLGPLPSVDSDAPTVATMSLSV